MPGIRIDVDTSRGISNLTDFRKALEQSGATAKLTDKELAALADRFRDKLQADRAEAALGSLRSQIERVGQAAGLSSTEISKLQNKMGLMSNSASQAGSSMTSLASNASSMGTSFSSLAVKVGAAVAAYISLKEAASFLADSVMNAARYETLGVVITQVGQNAGYTKDQMMGFAEGIEKAGISMIDARESLSKMAVAQLDLSKSSELARVAQDAAAISGTNSSVAFSKIVQGITTGQTILLHHAGIMVDLNDAYKKYAAQLGTTKENLDETQKQTAALNAVLENGATRAGVYESAMMTAGKQITSFQRYIEDLKTVIGTAFLDQFTETVFNSAIALKQLKDVMATPEAQTALAALTQTVSDLINYILQNVPAAIEVFAKLIGTINSVKEAVKNYQSALPEYFGWFGEVAAKAISAFSTSNVEKLGMMNSKLAEMKAQYASMAEGTEKDALADRISQGTQAIQKFTQAAKNAHDNSNRVLPTKEDADAANKYWAEYNDGVKKYKEATQGTFNLADSKEGQKHLPIDEQKAQAAKDYQKAMDQTAVAWNAAYKAGKWDDVDRANKAATVTLGTYNDKLDALDRKANRGAKSAQNAAIAAERYGSQAQAYLENVQQSLDQMDDTLTGAGNKESDRVDKWFTQSLNQAQKAMIGAKGETAAYQQAIDLLTSSYQRLHDLAVQKDMISSLKQQAEIWQQLAQVLDTPALNQKASDSSNAAWTAELSQKINGQASGEAKRVWDDAIKAANTAGSDMVAVWQGVADKWTAIDQDRNTKLAALEQASNEKRLQGQADAYKDYAAVSSKYWEAERQLIEAHLDIVKANADDELAYKVYAAQQWDEYNKKQLEQQSQTAGTFADTFAARWSLHFGSYKSEMAKTKESWDQMSDAIINSTDGMIDGVAGGFGDMIRNIGNGTASIEDLWRNMLSRMLDAFASFVEELIKTKLKDLVGGWFGSSGTQQSTPAMAGLVSGQQSGGGGIDFTQLSGLWKGFGKEAGSEMGDYLTTAASSGQSVFGSSTALAKIFGDGLDMSSLGSSALWASNTGAVSESAMASTYGTAETAAMSGTSILSTVGGVLGVVGGVAGLIGIVSSLFGEKKEEIKKVASGYNVQYAYGKTATSGVDFYSDGSVVGTGVGDPDVTRKISKAFKDAAENLQDFADTLGFTVDVLDNFQMPSMNITDSQLDTYIRNGSNAMAFQALEQAGLRGAFDALAEDGEVYIDEFKRLNDAFSVGSNKLTAYGRDMAAVAQVSDEQIEALRTKTVETAAGTSQAILAMAQSMGATSDQLALLSANASDGSQALSVTNEQLQNLAVADWISKVEDQVGGSDAFNAIMDNLNKNIFDSIEAYAKNLGYYNDMAHKYISQLGDDGITVDNFWTKFNDALNKGMDPETFEIWGKASGWVDAINNVNDALADWNEGMNQLYATLDARAQEAAGVSKTQIAVNQQIASAEKELYDARKANYDATYLAALQEVQAAELAQKQYEAAKEQRTTIEALITREMKASNSPWADAVSAQYQNRWDYQEASSSGLYSAEQLARLKAVQAKEVQALFDSVAESFEKNAADAKSRLLRAVGNTDEADLYDKQVSVANELKDALKSNLYTAEAYADLVAATSAEVKSLIEQQARDAAKYASDIQVRYLTVSGKAYDAAILTKQVAAEQELYEARQKGLEGTATYAQLEQVLAMEMADLIAQQAREQESYRAGLQARILTAQGYEYEANEVTAMAAAEAELADARAKGYDAATLALLAEAQAAEAAKRVADQIQKIRSDWASLESRLAIANGDSLTGNWTAYKSTQEQELYDALSSGKDQAYYNKLKEVQQAEAIAKWKGLIEDAVNDIKDKLNEVVSKFKDAMDSFNSLLETQISATSSLANNAESVHKSLQSTIKSITVGDDSVLTGAQKAQSLAGHINTAYQQMLSAGHGQARIDAASTLESLAQDYLSALRSSSNSDQYLQGYLDTISKLKEAQSITGQEQNYQTRLLDLMEAEKNILELINKELSKQTPDIEKLKALQNTSGMLGGYIQGLYNNDEATVNSWQKSVVSLLSEAGFSGEDIASALNGSSMTSFLDAMNEFNHTTLPTYFEDILSYLAKIAEAGEYTPPDPGDGYTDTEKNWASNLAVAMNAQHYGGSAAWSQASVLKNLATYAAWGNNYGVSSTQGYSAPKSNDKQYYYGAADLLNAKNGDTRTWLDIQNDVTSLSGSGNYLAHWLQYGFSDNIKFPSVDAVMKKTADYFEKKWKNEPSLSASPLTLAHDIADIMGLRFDNSAATLEYIAKKHYDTWIKGKPIEQLEPSDWGLVQPYALGGVAPAGTLALVGEYGPELMNIGSTSAITPHNATLNVLGDAYADSTAQLKAEIRELRRQNEMLYAAVREIVVNTKKSKDVIEKGDAIGFPVRTVS